MLILDTPHVASISERSFFDKEKWNAEEETLKNPGEHSSDNMLAARLQEQEYSLADHSVKQNLRGIFHEQKYINIEFYFDVGSVFSHECF